eukprot:CAMPEP_0172501106 /NCGR_PEP_ID=MMETSP1066-20121228/146159_1 /TAXON_ID=671091 /ORGANISM="Coscinodiscus wailesii, Strain CCMP2513" /LENGTH=495 /DNA_ID=CAMNT_0013275711 /DNA_START=54 /DNA_END=1541 /DNA_ORIENTATION=+
MRCTKRTTLVLLCLSQLSSSFTVPVITSRRAVTTPLNVATDPTTNESDTTSASETSSNSSGDKWWQSHTLSHSELATSVRSDFEILSTVFTDDDDDDDDSTAKALIYLDSAATSQKPKQVLDALRDYYTTSNANVHRGAHALSRRATEQYEAARDTARKFVNARSRNEIVFTSGATEAINLVASTLGRKLKAGDEIVVSVMEHHSNIVPWQIVAKDTGAVVKFVPVNEEGELDREVLEGLICPRTKVVSLQHVSNVMGCVNDVDGITRLVRERAHPDVKILLDACQSCPHMPVDVQSLGVDFLAASGHKMCGPTGIGFLWGREEVLNSLEPFMGGGEMIDEVTTEGSTYAKSPARFEAGTPPIAQAIGMARALEYLMDIGMDKIHDNEKELGAYLYNRLSEVEGVTILGPTDVNKRTAIASFVCDGVHPSDLSTFLDMDGVAIRAGHHCCQPLHKALGYSHSARASLYFYNTKQDVDVFIEKLEETLAFFRNMEV